MSWPERTEINLLRGTISGVFADCSLPQESPPDRPPQLLASSRLTSRTDILRSCDVFLLLSDVQFLCYVLLLYHLLVQSQHLSNPLHTGLLVIVHPENTL